ncbi:hypothetical protein CBL_01826 [Carabus blaptoides fortunei]
MDAFGGSPCFYRNERATFFLSIIPNANINFVWDNGSTYVAGRVKLGSRGPPEVIDEGPSERTERFITFRVHEYRVNWIWCLIGRVKVAKQPLLLTLVVVVISEQPPNIGGSPGGTTVAYESVVGVPTTFSGELRRGADFNAIYGMQISLTRDFF